MVVARSRVTAQGKTTVPSEVRLALGVGRGSVLEWVQERDNMVVRRVGRFSSEDIRHVLFGKKKLKTRSIKELKEGIQAHIRERY